MNACCQKQLNSQLQPISLGTKEKYSVDAFEVGGKGPGKDGKELAPRDSKDMSTLRNKSILTTSLHLRCFGEAVPTVDLSWKNRLRRSQTETKRKLKINLCIPRIDTLCETSGKIYSSAFMKSVTTC